jgi:hypothetical protein
MAIDNSHQTRVSPGLRLATIADVATSVGDAYVDRSLVVGPYEFNELTRSSRI